MLQSLLFLECRRHQQVAALHCWPWPTILRLAVHGGHRKGMFSPTFHISGPCRDTQIYNNLIYITKKPNANIDRTLLQMDNWGGPWPEDTKFWNNICSRQFPIRMASRFSF